MHSQEIMGNNDLANYNNKLNQIAMKAAIFYKRTKQICLFYSKNTTGFVYCASVQNARGLIKNTGVPQELIINNN